MKLWIFKNGINVTEATFCIRYKFRCYETISHLNEVKAESPLQHICLEFRSSIRIHYKVTGLQSLEKIILFTIFAQKWALPCVTKIILTEKLFGVGSSNFGFVHLDNWATH